MAAWAARNAADQRSLRQRSSFQPNSLEVVGEVLQHRKQRFRFARHLVLPERIGNSSRVPSRSITTSMFGGRADVVTGLRIAGRHVQRQPVQSHTLWPGQSVGEAPAHGANVALHGGTASGRAGSNFCEHNDEAARRRPVEWRGWRS
jgi:hypothetical protein